jgi:hypothetical protein
MINWMTETRTFIPKEESECRKDAFLWSDGIYRFTPEGSGIGESLAAHLEHFRLAKKDR